MINPATRALLEDVRTYAIEAIDLVGDRTAAQVMEERMREHSVLRTVQIVGEAATQLLKLRPEGYEGLELREATRVRNILVHGYGKIRMERIIDVVRNDLPRLVITIDRLFGETE